MLSTENLKSRKEDIPVLGSFSEQGESEAVPDVVVAARAIEPGPQIVLRRIAELHVGGDIDRLGIRVVGQDAVVLREILTQTERAAVVDRETDRRDEQRKTKIGIGRRKGLRSAGSQAAGDAVYAGINRLMKP